MPPDNDKEEPREELQSKSMEATTNKKGEILLEATTVDDELVGATEASSRNITHDPSPVFVEQGASQNNEDEGAGSIDKPFWCKGWFWIAIIFILVGGGVAVFVLPGQDTTTSALPVTDTDNVENTATPSAFSTIDPLSSGFSVSPSNSPSNAVPLDTPLSPEDCVAVANGEDVSGQQDAKLQRFQVQLDEVLGSDYPEEATALELEEKI